MMQITVHRNDLLAAVTAARAVAQTRATIPVLTCLKLHANGDGRVLVEGCDLTRHVIDAATATIGTAGDIAMPADMLAGIVKALPETDIAITVDASTMVASIKAGRARYQVACLPGDDFPSLAEAAENVATLHLPTIVARRMLVDLMTTAEDPGGRHYMAGCHMSSRDDGRTLRAATTDGHRCTIVRHALPTAVTLPAGGIIVPKDSARALGDICDGDGDVVFAVSETRITATRRDRSIVSKLVEGEFPDVDRVTPALGRANRMTVARADLAALAARIISVVDAKVPVIKLIADGSTLTAYGRRDAHAPESEDAIDAVTAGRIETGISARYVMDQLGLMSGDRVTIEMGEAGSPLRFVDDANPDDVHVVMPMRY